MRTMIRKLQLSYAAISTLRRKSATYMTRAYGRTVYSSAKLSAKLYSTSRSGDSPTRLGCIPKIAAISHGGTIAPAHFAATWAYGSITFGYQRRWLREAGLPGSTKNLAGGSDIPITLQSSPSLINFRFLLAESTDVF